MNPAYWPKLSRCDYDAPEDPYVEVILNQNLKGERCAIQRYKEIADFTNGKDHTTHQIATVILNEELEHDQDIEDWLTDIQRMRDGMKKMWLQRSLAFLEISEIEKICRILSCDIIYTAN